MSAPRKHWSFSAWELAAQCPRRYKFRYIDGLPSKPNPFAARGTEIHSLGEQYLLGNISGIPAAYKDFSAELRGLKKAKAEPEQWSNVTRQWTPAGEDDRWIVSKLDARVRAKKIVHIIDFKSGKLYPDKHAAQGSLYAALEGAHSPGATVHVEFWYLDKCDSLRWTYTSDDVKREQELWTARGEALQSMKDFPPKPSYLCKWCDHATNNGGTCGAWKKA